MTFTPFNLAEGQLSNSKGTLYTVGVGKTVIVKNITLVNTDSSARTVNIYAKPGSTSRRIFPKDLSLAAGASCNEDLNLTLEAGDLIEGDASVANVVDYVISGVVSD